MASDKKSFPLVVEIPVPWSNRPAVMKASFWLTVVLAVLIMIFVALQTEAWSDAINESNSVIQPDLLKSPSSASVH